MQTTVIDQPPQVTAPAPRADDARPAPRLKISARFLLGIYAIIPLCFLAFALDRLFGGRTLFAVLPTSPESFFYFQLILGTPHIIASSVILATNVQYVHAFWIRLVLFTILLILFFGVGSLFISYDVFLAIVGAATVLHVIKQQVGIGKGLCRGSGWVYEIWGWTLIVFGSILYYAVYTSRNFAPETAIWIHGILGALAAFAFLLTVVCHFSIPTRIGRLYLWANAVMVLQCGLFYWQGYLFLVILGPRLVHDITAFTFYVAHDVNRHGEKPQNLLYRLASKLGLGIFWVGPAVAVLLTYLIGTYADPVSNLLVKPLLGYNVPYGASFLIVGYLAMLHYYTEAFTWRQGSPYREHLALTA